MNFATILVTHNSERCTVKAIDALRKQTHPTKIIVVDSGSQDPTYLESQEVDVLHLEKENVGFCKGNNIGLRFVDNADIVCFVNPDCFLSPTFIKQSLTLLEAHPQCGALSGILQGYDLQKALPKTAYDSTGIFQTWYGRWYDRGQGQEMHEEKYIHIEEVPALCGAALVCRRSAIDAIRLPHDALFDPDFFMYKEDIDLCDRLRRNGWKILFSPDLHAFHCRGWDRSKMSSQFKRLSAKNEWLLHWKMGSPLPLFYSSLKLLIVNVLNV